MHNESPNERSQRTDFAATRNLAGKGLSVLGAYLRSKAGRVPLFMHISPTSRCNLRCSYCYQWSEGDSMTWTAFVSAVDRAHKLGVRAVAFTGGEPLLWPHLVEAIAHCSSKGIATQVTSNGHMLTEDLVHQLGRAGLDMLSVSIDGVSALPTSEKTIASNPRVLSMQQRIRDTYGTFVSSNFVLHAENRSELPKVLEALGSAGIPVSIGFHVPPIDKESDPMQWAHFDDEIRLILDAKDRLGCIIDPVQYYREYPMFTAGKRTWDCFKAKSRTLMVGPDGSVLWCTKLGSPSPYKVAEMTREDFRTYEREFRRITSECEAKCYSNCAYCSFYYHSHPLEFTRTILAPAVLGRLQRNYERLGARNPVAGSI